jgi:hypothetical protein
MLNTRSSHHAATLGLAAARCLGLMRRKQLGRGVLETLKEPSMANMHRTKLIALFAGVGLTLAFVTPAASASASSAYCARWAQAQLDPYDLNVMRASVSASAGLAVAIRLRSLIAQCRAARLHPPHSG